MSNDDNLVYARLGTPNFARSAEDLAHAGRRAGQHEALELLCRWVEAYQRICTKVAQPDDIAVVHEYGIGLWSLAWQLPFAPGIGGWIVHAQLAGVPLANPHSAARIRPDA